MIHEVVQSSLSRYFFPQIGRIATVISGEKDASGEPILDSRPWYSKVIGKFFEFLYACLPMTMFLTSH